MRIHSILLQIYDLFALFCLVLSCTACNKTVGRRSYSKIPQRLKIAEDYSAKTDVIDFTGSKCVSFLSKNLVQNHSTEPKLTKREFLLNKIGSEQVPGCFPMCFPSFLTVSAPIFLVKLSLDTISGSTVEHPKQWIGVEFEKTEGRHSRHQI